DGGALRRFVNVYLNGEDIRFMSGLKTETPDGCELSIIPSVAGG
ncbi:MAG: MoaD/ThiS family protein, partial [bacterium]